MLSLSPDWPTFTHAPGGLQAGMNAFLAPKTLPTDRLRIVLPSSSNEELFIAADEEGGIKGQTNDPLTCDRHLRFAGVGRCAVDCDF